MKSAWKGPAGHQEVEEGQAPLSPGHCPPPPSPRMVKEPFQYTDREENS